MFQATNKELCEINCGTENEKGLRRSAFIDVFPRF